MSKLEIKELPGMIQVVEDDKVHASYSHDKFGMSKAVARLQAKAFKDGYLYAKISVPE